MTRSFIVTLNLDSADQSSLVGLAEDISESLILDGYSIDSVKPFAEKSSSTFDLDEPSAADLPPTGIF